MFFFLMGFHGLLTSHVVVLVKSFFGVKIFSFWSFYITVQHLGHFMRVCSFFSSGCQAPELFHHLLKVYFCDCYDFAIVLPLVYIVFVE